MKYMNKAGFTLIELLVVVLIIGILAAVAMPQYRFAVEKSRMAEPLVVLDAVKKAYHLCVLQNGENSEQCEDGMLDNLDIELPGDVVDCEGGSARCVETKGWVYASWGGGQVDAYRVNESTEYPSMDASWYLSFSGTNGDNIWCNAVDDSWFCNKLCGEFECMIK